MNKWLLIAQKRQAIDIITNGCKQLLTKQKQLINFKVIGN